MVALSGLNASTGGLVVGDWIYSIYQRAAPEYLPLNSATASYLVASYPALAAVLPAIYKVVPVHTAGILPSAAQWGYTLGYGVGTYISLGNANSYSTDGVTWVASSCPTSARSVAANNTTLVVMGQGNGTAATSINGTTWVVRTTPTDFNCLDLVYAGGVFVAVGQSMSVAVGTVALSSTDGATWTTRTIPSNAYGSLGQRMMAYGAGLFVAFAGTSGTRTSYATSPDGVNWTNRTFTPVGSAYITTVAFGNGIFVGMTGISGQYYTSTDGLTWTLNTFTNYGAPSNIAFGDGVFAVTYQGLSTVALTTDGVNWKTTTLAATSPSSLPFGITYGPSGSGTFVAMNSSSAGGGSTAPITASKMVAAISNTAFQLPVITPLTNTFTYVKAT